MTRGGPGGAGTAGHGGRPETDGLAGLREARSSLRAAVEAVPRGLRGMRPGPDRWSVAEVLDHLVRVEGTVAGLVRSMAEEVRAAADSGEAADSGAVAPPRADGGSARVRELRPVLDRSRRVRSADAFLPDRDADWADAWSALEASRAALVAELEAAAGLPLERAVRPHFAIGPLNGREWIVFAARHEERHAAQIREIARSLPAPPRAILFDLDNCLARADEIPDLLEPGFEAVRRANRGTLPTDELERALDECRRRPFDVVAREHGFSDAMVEAGRRTFAATRAESPMTGYPDLHVLGRLPGRRFLVTTGFRGLQRSKIDALGIAALFDGVHIDAIDDGRPRGKEAIFREILDEHGLRPEEALVVGDDPGSEIAAGNRLGIPTVQLLRPGVAPAPEAGLRVAGLEELRDALVAGPASGGARTGLVIFDCDGVLVDSEPIAHRVLIEKLAEIGVAFTLEEAIDAFLGRSVSAGLPAIEERLGGPAPEHFVADYQAALRDALLAEVEAVPGVVDVLDGLAVPACVASNSGHDVIRAELGRVGLLERFEGRIFSAADVPRGKPAPDLFLHAARSMGVPPDRCAVVEDTEVGVRAAVAAGMTVFGFAGMTPAGALESAGARVFRSMDALPALLDGAMSGSPNRGSVEAAR